MPSQGERGHLGQLDTQLIGTRADVPATAPQSWRLSQATALPILRLALCVMRCDSCTADPLSMGSERCVIGFLFKVLPSRCLRA